MFFLNLSAAGLLLCFALLWLLAQLAIVSSNEPHVVEATLTAQKTIKNALFTPLREIPGPLYAIWTNLVLKYHILSGKRSQYIHSLHRKYGPYVRISPNEIAIADLSSVNQIHRVGSNFRKSDWYTTFNDSSHPGIFSLIDQKEHANRRRLFAQNCSNSSLLRFEPQIRAKVDTAISKIKRDALASKADILKWFTFMATDVIGELSFGVSFDMLKQEEKTQYIRDLETTMMISGIRAELSTFVKLAGYLPIPTIQNALKLSERLDAYGRAALENQKEYLNSSKDTVSTSLFSKFLDSTKNNELSIPQISAEASNLIIAGSDTTAVSLTYLVWTLHRPQHRDIKEKLLVELDSLPMDASLADVSNLRYLRMVVDESLRLYGAAPGSLPRVCPPKGAKLGGYFMPGGTIVSTQAYTLHRDGTIFEDPESFIPERWEAPTESMKHAFMPFGRGSRACIGMHLAVNELLLGTFVFLKTCASIRLADSATDSAMEIENYFLIAPKSHRCELEIAG